MKYLFKALLFIFLTVTCIFFLARLAPGDPVEQLLGENATMEERLELRQVLGLNRNIFEQYFHYITRAIQGDFGNSLFKQYPVKSLISERIFFTFTLGIISVLISTFFGVILGMMLANMPRFDKIGYPFFYIPLAVPLFTLGPFLILVFSIYLNWLPVTGVESWQGYLLPLLNLVIPLTCVATQVVRSQFLEHSGDLWVQVLRAKGLSSFDQSVRILKLISPAIIQIVSLQLSVVLSGVIVTESIFDLPGLGLLLFDALTVRDYPVIQGAVCYMAIPYIALKYFGDFISQKLDPRLKTQMNQRIK